MIVSYTSCHIMKNFGSKKVWWMRTVGSLAEKTLANWSNFEVHLHGNVMKMVKKLMKKIWQIAVICPSFLLPMFFPVRYVLIFFSLCGSFKSMEIMLLNSCIHCTPWEYCYYRAQCYSYINSFIQNLSRYLTMFLYSYSYISSSWLS